MMTTALTQANLKAVEHLQAVKDDPVPEPDEFMPKAVGHKLVVVVDERPETFDGTAIVKSEQTQILEQHMMQVGRVIDMGPDCYTGTDAGGSPKFPGGPWCQLGDYVLLDRYGGTKFRIGKLIVRIVNDDFIEATVDNPRLLVKLGA